MKECVGIYDIGARDGFSWDDDFPPVYSHTSISYLKQCPGFEKAKHGDLQAAADVVSMCIKPHRIVNFRDRYADAVLLPVITDNRLPEAFANQVGMKVHTGVYKQETPCRKTLTAMERLLYRPCFTGSITASVRYIIVDDIVTQGGTISALRKYVMLNGGTVTAATSLAYSTNSGILVPDERDVYELINKFTYASIIDILKKYSIADDVWELTRSQVRYLLRFEKLEHIINSILRISEKPEEVFSAS